MDLRICVEIPDSLDIHHHQLVARSGGTEVRSGLDRGIDRSFTLATLHFALHVLYRVSFELHSTSFEVLIVSLFPCAIYSQFKWR